MMSSSLVLSASLLFFFLMIRRPPRSTLFPTRRSSDLSARENIQIEPARERLQDLIHVRQHEVIRSEEHTSELQSRQYLVCRLLLEKKKKKTYTKNCQPQ